MRQISQQLTILLSCFLINLSVLKAATQNSPHTLQKYNFSKPQLGTITHIILYHDQEKQATQLAQQCFQQVNQLNHIFSDYTEDSELTQLCQKPLHTPHKVSHHLFTVIAKAQAIANQTNGAFDITLGKHTQAWRKQSNKINQHTTSHIQHSTSPKALSNNLSDTSLNTQHLKLDHNKQTITLLHPLKLDLGGIAKGYIADQLMHTLKQANIHHCAVIIGGETILAAAPPGKKGWKIGIENPAQQIIGTLTLSHTALSTSGDSYQCFEHNGTRQSHLIDPATKTSKTNKLNVTVIAPTAMEADAWATALRILPTPQALTIAKQHTHIQALFTPHNKTPLTTKQFPTITTKNK